jgi:hypothetical protein
MTTPKAITQAKATPITTGFRVVEVSSWFKGEADVRALLVPVSGDVLLGVSALSPLSVSSVSSEV